MNGEALSTQVEGAHRKENAMYVVIFRATAAELDGAYDQSAEYLRRLALERYGCTEFVSMSHGRDEVALSYWPSLEHIKAWREDIEHLAAQERGRAEWYQRYDIQVCQVVREYSWEKETSETVP
jgi:heme-degrading monooxygenase HmoA